MVTSPILWSAGEGLGFLTGLGEEDELAQIAEGGSATGGDPFWRRGL